LRPRKGKKGKKILSGKGECWGPEREKGYLEEKEKQPPGKSTKNISLPAAGREKKASLSHVEGWGNQNDKGRRAITHREGERQKQTTEERNLHFIIIRKGGEKRDTPG